MPYNIATPVKLLRIFGAGLAIIMMAAVDGVGAAPNLHAIICGDTPASLTVNRPQSDSVTNERVIVLSGEVAQASQLEVYVDDMFNGVEPLAHDAATYTTTIDLAPGTHTIKLVAVDTCQVGNATASVILTYQPISVPSSGSATPTNVEGAITGTEQSIPPLNVFDTFIAQPAISIVRSLDLITYDTNTNNDNRANLFRFSAILIGVLLVALSGRIRNFLLRYATAAGFSEGVASLLRVKGRKIVIIIGIVIICIVFII